MDAFGPEYWLFFGFIVVFTLVLLAIRLRAFRTSRGIVEGAKSTIQQNIDVAAVNIEVAKERLEVERALVAATAGHQRPAEAIAGPAGPKDAITPGPFRRRQHGPDVQSSPGFVNQGCLSLNVASLDAVLPEPHLQ